MIRAASEQDADAIAAIYSYYVTDTIVTFEEEPPSRSEISRRIATVRNAGLPWVVAEDNDAILGYAYATPCSRRCSSRSPRSRGNTSDPQKAAALDSRSAAILPGGWVGILSQRAASKREAFSS